MKRHVVKENLAKNSLKDDEMFNSRIITYSVMGSIIVQLISCLAGLDLAALFHCYCLQIYSFAWIQTSKKGYHPYSDTSPNEAGEYYLS